MHVVPASYGAAISSTWRTKCEALAWKTETVACTTAPTLCVRGTQCVARVTRLRIVVWVVRFSGGRLVGAAEVVLSDVLLAGSQDARLIIVIFKHHDVLKLHGALAMKAYIALYTAAEDVGEDDEESDEKNEAPNTESHCDIRGNARYAQRGVGRIFIHHLHARRCHRPRGLLAHASARERSQR